MRHGSIVRIFKVQRIDSYNKTTSPSAKCSSEIWQISNFQAAKFNRNYPWLNMPTVDSTHGLFSWRSLAICIGLTSQEDNVCCSKKQCSPLGKKYLALLKSKISCQKELFLKEIKKSSHITSQCTQIWEKSLQIAKKNSYSKCFLHQYACFRASCLYSFLRTRKLLMLCKDSFCNLKSFWNMWLFPKTGVPLNQSKSSILIRFSIILTIHCAVPLFWNTHILLSPFSSSVPFPFGKSLEAGIDGIPCRWQHTAEISLKGFPCGFSQLILWHLQPPKCWNSSKAPYLWHRSHGDRFSGCGLPVGFFWSNKKPTSHKTTGEKSPTASKRP